MLNIVMMMTCTGGWLWLDCILFASLATVSVIFTINIITGCCGMFGSSQFIII